MRRRVAPRDFADGPLLPHNRLKQRRRVVYLYVAYIAGLAALDGSDVSSGRAHILEQRDGGAVAGEGNAARERQDYVLDGLSLRLMPAAVTGCVEPFMMAARASTGMMPLA